MSISYLNKKIACVVGKVDGSISHKPKGKNGFGYDPIFIPKRSKKTFGEMKPSKKYKLVVHAVSHKIFEQINYKKIKNQGTLIYDVKGKINDFSDQSL